jgi:hypothetical protein
MLGIMIGGTIGWLLTGSIFGMIFGAFVGWMFSDS